MRSLAELTTLRVGGTPSSLKVATTQAQIIEGMDMIQNGYKKIKQAVGVEAGRSIALNLPKKMTTEDLINLI